MLSRPYLWGCLRFARSYSYSCLTNKTYNSSNTVTDYRCHLVACSPVQKCLGCHSQWMSYNLPSSHINSVKICKRNFSEERSHHTPSVNNVIDSCHNSPSDNIIDSSKHEVDINSSVPYDNSDHGSHALTVANNKDEDSISQRSVNHHQRRRKFDKSQHLSRFEQTGQENELNNSESCDVSSTVSDTSLSKENTSQKVEIPPLYSVSPIVNESEVLKNLVELGVDLSTFVRKDMASKIIMMDFKKHVQPYIMFLYNAGVTEENLGQVLTKNPYIFEHEINHLKVRVKYLKSKRFTKQQIGLMITRQPTFLCMTTKRIDAKLGYYQKEWKLKGQELRDVATIYPNIIIEDVKKLKNNKVYMKAFWEFTSSELRQMFLDYPKIFFGDLKKYETRYEYLSKDMGIPNSMITRYAWVLDRNLTHMENRHRFLIKKGRAQYDPTKENYVSLQDLMQADKTQFCTEVAKASVKEFDDFQRLL